MKLSVIKSEMESIIQNIAKLILSHKEEVLREDGKDYLHQVRYCLLYREEDLDLVSIVWDEVFELITEQHDVRLEHYCLVGKNHFQREPLGEDYCINLEDDELKIETYLEIRKANMQPGDKER